MTLNYQKYIKKMNNEQDSNMITGTSSINKHKHLKRNEPLSSENGNATQLKNAQKNNPGKNSNTRTEKNL